MKIILRNTDLKFKYCEFKTKPKYKDAYMFDCIDKIEIDDILQVSRNTRIFY